MSVWIPLQGPGSDRPKAPAVAGWQSPGYIGVPERMKETNWLGLRCDNLVVIDCDNDEALERWNLHVGVTSKPTFVRKTPRGWHLFYRQIAGSPDAPGADILGGGSGVDIRAGRTSQVVYHAPDYYDFDIRPLQPFDPAWWSRPTQVSDADDEWDEMPDGRGDNTMTALAGAMRKQGMSYEAIFKSLAAINNLTMTRDPMPASSIARIAGSVSRYAPEPDIDLDVEEGLDEGTDETDQADLVYMDARKMTVHQPKGFMWEPYLPVGTMVLVEGQEGIGKSMYAAWVAVQVATGRAFPDGDAREPASVLWYSAEDDPHDEILPRLHSLGYTDADAPIRFFNPLKHKDEPRFPRDIEKLRIFIANWGVKLLIIDPGRDFLAPEDDAETSNNNERALRPGLRALARIANDLECTILFLHHQNKRSSNEATARERSTGSGAFRQVARVAMTMSQVGEFRAFAIDKANNFPHDFTVSSYEILSNDDGQPCFRPGGKMAEYRTIDSWTRTTQKLVDEGAGEIVVEIDWKEAAFHYSRYLNEGDIAPTWKDIVHDIGVDAEEAQQILVALRERKIIKNGLWYRLPKDAPKAPQEAEDHDGME